MEREDQKQLIANFIDSIKQQILMAVDAGRVPEEWDGIELMWYLKELTSWECEGLVGQLMTRKRRSAYRSVVYRNSL